MASPIPFISWNASLKQFEVNPQAGDVLQKLSGPVAVLAVCGRARQGKSFLLNQLLAKLGSKAGPGFQVGPTTKPCTKGLWLWSAPVVRTTPGGLKYNLVFLDCEGIDAFDQSKDYSTHVFSLAVLLSSLMVYNQLGSIDESSVEALATVCEFSKVIRSKASTTGGNQAMFASPSFLWLLRDFHLQLSDGNRTMTPNGYMEEVLAPRGHPAKDQLRAAIRELFPERECVTLVRPLNDEAALATMDSLPLDKLRPEFKQGLATLLNQILARATPKSFAGSYLSGRALVTLAQAYTTVLNKGQVPSLSSTWQAVLSSENQRALDTAFSEYCKHMDVVMTGTSVDMLDAKHAEFLGAAVALFESQALGDSSERATYLTKLKAMSADRYQHAKQAAVARSEKHALDLLSAGARKLTPLLSCDPPDLVALERDLKALLDNYHEQTSGPLKFKLAAEFLVNTVVTGLSAATTRALKSAATATTQMQAAEKELNEARQKVALAEQRAQSASTSESLLRNQLTTAQTATETVRQQVEARNRDLAAAQTKVETTALELAQAKRQVADLEARLSSAQQQGDKATTSLSSLQAELERARSELSTLRAQLRSGSVELDRVRSELNSSRLELERLRAAQAASQTDAATTQSALAVARKETQDARTALATARQEAAQAQTQMLALKQEAATAQQQVATLRQELLAAQSQAAGAAGAQQEAQRLRQEHTAQVGQLRLELDQAQAAAREAEARVGVRDAEINSLRFQLQSAQQQAGAAAAQQVQAVVTAVDDEEMEDMEDGEEGGAGTSTGARGTKRRRVQAVRRGGAAVARTPERAAADNNDDDAGGANNTPFSNERRVDIRPERRTPGASSGAQEGAAAGGSKPAFDKMTINEIKEWLTDKGLEAEVVALNNGKPKKSDWVKLANSKA